jgi:hypothetical protein
MRMKLRDFSQEHGGIFSALRNIQGQAGKKNAGGLRHFRRDF